MTKFCMSVDIHDVITCATFYDDRLRGLGVTRGRISSFPIDLRRRPYNTLALPCYHYAKFDYDPRRGWCGCATVLDVFFSSFLSFLFSSARLQVAPADESLPLYA